LGFIVPSDSGQGGSDWKEFSISARRSSAWLTRAWAALRARGRAEQAVSLAPGSAASSKVYALFREVHMTEAEVHARAILAGALIQSGSIDVNSANLAADWRVQPNTERLHHLVDLLYRAITETRE
jgi:hypothetical protein